MSDVTDLKADVLLLRRENAKLRKMVADMWRSSVAKMDLAERYAFLEEFVDRMRELGIEVG